MIEAPLECHCIEGHRSTHLTHACIDCGFPDSAVMDGQPIPPCKPRCDLAETDGNPVNRCAGCNCWKAEYIECDGTMPHGYATCPVPNECECCAEMREAENADD